MLEYALTFYNNHFILFYLLLTIAVILEWPITILSLSIVAINFKISFYEVIIFSFIWEFFWDLLHYIIWRFFRVNIFNNKNYSLLIKTEKKLKNHSLFEQLMIIKYTPILTNIWLLYLWFKKTDLFKYIRIISIFALINWIVLTTIWYNFWYLFKGKIDFSYFIIILFLSFIFFYFLIKVGGKYIINRSIINK